MENMIHQKISDPYLSGESEEGSEDDQDEEEGGSSQMEEEESETSRSGSSEESEDEAEEEPVLKYKRFAKEVVTSITDPTAKISAHICSIAVHPKVMTVYILVCTNWSIEMPSASNL